MLSLQVFLWPKYHFWYFFWPDLNTARDMAICMYLKHSPDCPDSKYIKSIGLNSLGPSVTL